MEKNNAKIINAWSMYDWANSVYSLVITSTIFPLYFRAIAIDEKGQDTIEFLGLSVHSSALFSFCISFAFLLVAAINPFLTAIADYSHRKKRFLKIFCYLGAISCSLLYFATTDTLIFSVLVFVLATMGYTGSIVFYNAYLPEIATPDQFDRISAKGFALGYAGSVLLLLFNLSMVLEPAWYGITKAEVDQGLPARFSFLSVGIWWVLFAQYTFYYLPSRKPNKEPGLTWLFKGFQELRKVLSELQHQRKLKRFLVAFFFYSMGVQTVMYMAAIFGDKELKMPADNLIITVLIIQLVAIAGAYGFAWLSKSFGNIQALMMSVAVWIAICIGAYFVKTSNEFYVLAAVVGVVMGGIQALSRSTYAKFIPKNTVDTASYFNFYDVVEKLSIVLGTLMYGLVEQLTNSARISIIVLGILFLAGLFFLVRVLLLKTQLVNVKSN